MTRTFRAFTEFLRPTFRYWMETETHVFCFSIAANVLLSFFPFLVVMESLCKYVLHWQGAVQAIYIALKDYFPGAIADFVQINLKNVRPIEFLSLILLLFTANGVFEPLEVALNHVWGIRKNRSFLKNQLVSYGLIFICGTLALISTAATAVNGDWLRQLGIANPFVATFLGATFFKLAAIPLAMLALFLIYWLLPNAEVPRDRIIVAAIGVGLLLEVLKYVELLAWPFLYRKLQREYGPFGFSVAIILFSFFGSMLVLAGAEWASRPSRETGRVLKTARG